MGMLAALQHPQYLWISLICLYKANICYKKLICMLLISGTWCNEGKKCPLSNLESMTQFTLFLVHKDAISSQLAQSNGSFSTDLTRACRARSFNPRFFRTTPKLNSYRYSQWVYFVTCTAWDSASEKIIT